MRLFGKYSLAAVAAASLVCAPVMAQAMQGPTYTDTEKIAAATPAVEIANEAQANTHEAPINAMTEQDFVIMARFAFGAEHVHFAVIRSGPSGITSLQMNSLVNLPVQSQFINYANRYRASYIT